MSRNDVGEKGVWVKSVGSSNGLLIWCVVGTAALWASLTRAPSICNNKSISNVDLSTNGFLHVVLRCITDTSIAVVLTGEHPAHTSIIMSQMYFLTDLIGSSSASVPYWENTSVTTSAVIPRGSLEGKLKSVMVVRSETDLQANRR